MLGGFYCYGISETLVGKGRGEWEQVQLACLGKRPERASLSENAAVTTAETREKEFLGITTQTSSHSDQE